MLKDGVETSVRKRRLSNTAVTCFLCSPNKEAAITMASRTVAKEKGARRSNLSGQRCLY